jgi:hypothetical protein
VAQVVNGFHGAIEAKVEGLANDVKRAIGAPIGGSYASNGAATRGFSANTGASGTQSSSSASAFNTGAGDGAAGIPRAD